MKRIFVVVDTDNARAIKAFRDEERADNWSYQYYENHGIDTRVDEVWFDEVGADDDD